MAFFTKMRFTKKRLGFQSNIGLLLILLAGFSTAVCAGGIYKWVDEKGNVHYSQDPQHQSAQQMQLKIPKSSSTSTGQETAPATAQDANKDDGEQKEGQNEAVKEADAKKQEQETRKKNCQIAMQRMAGINAGGRLYEVDEKGERHYWDDSTRKAKLAEAQSNVDEWCNQE